MISVAELRAAARSLGKRPGFCAAAILTVALGVALNTAVFGVVNSLFFRPLPFRDGERLMVLFERNAGKGQRARVSYPTFQDWSRENSVFETMAAMEESSAGLGASGALGARRVSVARITAGALELFGFVPVLGRAFDATEMSTGRDATGARPVLVGERLWKAHFLADPAIAGREIRLEGERAVVLGVLPWNYRFLYGGYDVVTPLLPPPDASREQRTLQVVARRKIGVSPDVAQAAAAALGKRVAARHVAGQGWDAVALDYRKAVFGEALRMYPVLLAASTLLLLLVCANVSNLFLARVAAGTKEIAVRLALGAGRWRVVRQLLTEGVLITGAGGACAMLCLIWLRWYLMARFPELSTFRIDWRVFLFTAAASALAGVAVSLAPALAASRVSLNEAMKNLAGGLSAAAPHRARRALVVVQFSFALALLAGSGLLVKTVLNLRTVPTGFNSENLLMTVFSAGTARFPTPERQWAYQQKVLRRAAAVPGVKAAALASASPLSGAIQPQAWEVEGDAAPRFGSIARNHVTPAYFAVLETPLLAGRSFTDGDSASAAPVCMVNEAMARAIASEPAAAVGRRLRLGGGVWRTVVGVAGNTKQDLLRPTFPEVVLPLAQEPVAAVSLLMRTQYDPQSVAPALRAGMRSFDADLPLGELRTMRQFFEDYFPRVMLGGLLIFSGLALLLAALGLYGVVSFLAARRTREFGIRMALGARPSHVLRLVLREGAGLAGAGLAIGTAAAVALARLLAGTVHGVSPWDPSVLFVAASVLMGTALAACLLPACRAASEETSRALKYD